MREWLIRHPNLIAIALAAWAAWVAIEAFEAGRELGAVEVARGELDRIASEALGG